MSIPSHHRKVPPLQPSKGRALAALLLLLASVGVGCRRGADWVLLDSYFAACRLRDLTALAPFATVVFEPRTDGIVRTFEVTKQTSERLRATAPLSIADERIANLSLAEAASTAHPAFTLSGTPSSSRSGSTSLVERDVTIDAEVRAPDGSLAPRTLVVTVQQARGGGSTERSGRWVVTGFR